MTLRIDDFKGQLPGGGARPNLFRVEGGFPSPVSGLLAEVGGAEKETSRDGVEDPVVLVVLPGKIAR